MTTRASLIVCDNKIQQNLLDSVQNMAYSQWLYHKRTMCGKRWLKRITEVELLKILTPDVWSNDRWSRTTVEIIIKTKLFVIYQSELGMKICVFRQIQCIFEGQVLQGRAARTVRVGGQSLYAICPEFLPLFNGERILKIDWHLKKLLKKFGTYPFWDTL